MADAALADEACAAAARGNGLREVHTLFGGMRGLLEDLEERLVLSMFRQEALVDGNQRVEHGLIALFCMAAFLDAGNSRAEELFKGGDAEFRVLVADLGGSDESHAVEWAGGAAGPLYGMGFVRASEVCDEDTKLSVASFEKLLGAAIAGIEKRGHAKKGDKTMLDALIPIHECFLPEHAEDKTLFEVLQEASHAAKEGVDFTKTIAARRGRASLVGERSIGHEDPGAVSSMLMYRALYNFLRK